MDVRKIEINSGDILPSEDSVFRHALSTDIEKADKFMPRVKCFSLTEADKAEGFSLSNDWEKLTTPELTVSRVGCTFKFGTQTFKPYENRAIYSLSINFLNEIKGVQNVMYNPIEHTPAIKGSPNNPAHSLVVFSPDIYNKSEAEILLKMRNHAKDRKVNFDIQKVTEIVNNYRSSFE